VQYTISPVTGDAMAFICTLVIRGAKNPFVVLVTSNAAELLGVEVPMPIWEKEIPNKKNTKKFVKINLVSFILF
jgi:hypothetical protein